jgi:hypothetical protein
MYAQFLGYDGTPYTDAFDKKHFLEDWKRALAVAPTPPTKSKEVRGTYGLDPLPPSGGRIHVGDTYCDEEKKGGPW